MNCPKKFIGKLMLLMVLSSSLVAYAGTFNIENIHVHDQVENIRQGIMVVNKTSTSNPKAQVFIPQIEVKIKVDRDAASKNLMAKAYYFNSSGQLIQAFTQPSVVTRQVSETDSARGTTQTYVWPTTLLANKPENIYFPLPDKLPDTWTVVVILGNTNGAVAASVPDEQGKNLNYPEHDLVEKTLLSPQVELTNPTKAVPVIEQVVQSDNPRYPAFTLLMHLPHGVTDPKDVSGVLATCLVANTVGEMRDQLNAIKPEDDPNPYYAYAEAHNLAVIAWGARWVWNSYANFDELDKNQNRTSDDDFQKLANAWDKGIQNWIDKYKMPDHDYLMYGHSAGGEWVHRLALHKPERFLAVQMHVSASYDAPTPEASHLLWLLTTGERDGGCDDSRRFYKAARSLSYPIVFKAIIGLGHADSPIANDLGIRFFDYALALNRKRQQTTSDAFTQVPPLDLTGFNSSPYYGDLMNQEMFAAQDKEMIPPGFQVPLPTKEIADAWNH